MNRQRAGRPKQMTSFPEATRHPFSENSRRYLASTQLPVRWYVEVFYLVTGTEALIDHLSYLMPLLQ